MITIIWAVRAFYILSSIAILIVRLIPTFADRFLAYGARDQARGKPSVHAPTSPPSTSVGVHLLDYLATFQVPHSWFTHFYITSVALSIAGLCIFRDGTNLTVPSIPLLSATLMLAQGARRLVECLILTKPSQSRMWIGHYAIGLAFYVATNMAIWIEHLALDPEANEWLPRDHRHQPVDTRWWYAKALLCTSIFVYASYRQHVYHHYLAHLRKYTLPNRHGADQIIAPHYTAECIIYLSLAVLDAPPRQPSGHLGFVNGTLLCAVVFVTVNLGVTAQGTRVWMLQKFPEKRAEIEKRYTMLPILRWQNGKVW